MCILSALNDLLRKYCIDTDNSDPSPVYSVIISLRLFFYEQVVFSSQFHFQWTNISTSLYVTVVMAW